MTKAAPLVVGIGEVLWDRFPDGDRLGGAPANFAFHAGQLGASSRIVSCIGWDADGDRLSALLAEHGVSLEYLQRDPRHPTGTVLVHLQNGQPTYHITTPVAWDELQWTKELEELAHRVDGVAFGTLSQRGPVSRTAIQTFLKSTSKTALRLFNINLRQAFYTREVIEFGLKHATVLKLNQDELLTLSRLLGTAADAGKFAAQMRADYGIQCVALTRGEEGCELHAADQIVTSKPPPIKCIDAVGAGDAFAAALMMGLLRGEPLRHIADTANRIGAYVASQAGAMPRLPETLLAA